MNNVADMFGCTFLLLVFLRFPGKQSSEFLEEFPHGIAKFHLIQNHSLQADNDRGH
jgi:hypothetical protein